MRFLQNSRKESTVSIFIRREICGAKAVREHVIIFIWGRKSPTEAHQQVIKIRSAIQAIWAI
jgi:hypothetical protein